jgi:mRNA-degrading endonuclease toxin of MazEF toxin-antitoxin module
MPRAATRRQDAPLVQLSGDCASNSNATRLTVLISRPQQHRLVEVVQLAIPVEKRAYLQRRDAP